MKFGNGKSTKEIMQILSGILLIVLVFILNGFLSFVTVGFDFSQLATTAYWANFFILFASEMAVMFGVYIIQKLKDLKNKKITDLQDEVQKKRDIVYGVDKVAQAEDWLREIYNYKEKLLIFERKIKSEYEKLKLEEPKQTAKFYEHKKKVYDKNIIKKDFNFEIRLPNFNLETFKKYIKEIEPTLTLKGKGNLKLKVSSAKFINIDATLKDADVNTPKIPYALKFKDAVHVKSRFSYENLLLFLLITDCGHIFCYRLCVTIPKYRVREVAQTLHTLHLQVEIERLREGNFVQEEVAVIA